METKQKKTSAYQQLAQIVDDIKQEKISVKQAMNKLKIKENSTKPYAKVSRNGAIALFNISKNPIVLYESQWKRLIKTIESGYMTKYMEYNKDRISHGKTKENDVKENDVKENDVSNVIESSISVEEVKENNS